MKKLIQLRAQGTEPETVVVNLTGRSVDYPNAYIAEPNGSIKSLYAANVVVIVDEVTRERGVESLNKIMAMGVLSLAIANMDSGVKVWILKDGEYPDLVAKQISLPEKRYGAYTESQLKELAGDDWKDIKDSPDMLNTFSYLCLANKQQIENAA